MQADLGAIARHADTLAALLRWSPRIDCLVNNAGLPSPERGDLLQVTPAGFDAVLDVNLRGTFFFTQAVARAMLAQPATVPRAIVTVSSVSAELASVERGAYCLSKAGLAMLTRLFALRLAPHGIGVFEVRPGIIRTPMTAGVAPAYDARIADGLVPMQRWGEPADVARVVAQLAAGGFAFATGSVIHADGGLAIPRL
jgi:NAD(P)-dependent dehydrogenase (short-subunit alcohol dehydrogenase family)